MSSFRIIRRIGVLLCALVLVIAQSSNLGAERAEEYQVKAAYLYNFAKFARFPNEGLDPQLTIGVLGVNPFDKAFEGLTGKKIQGRTVVIVQAHQPDSMIKPDLVFISTSEERRLQRILTEFEGQAVLTISDIEGFARRGGMIELVESQGRIELEINLRKVRNAGIEIPYQLLELAQRVME